MAVPAQDKPIQKLREETIDQLTVNYAQGELSFEAFDRRLDQAIEAQDHSTLTALTQDLELKVDKQYIDQKKREVDELPYRENNKEPEKIVTTLGSSKRRIYGEIPEEFQLTNIMGNQNLDFCGAEIPHNTVCIHVFKGLSKNKIHKYIIL